MMVKNSYHFVAASKIASESHGLSAAHGSRLFPPPPIPKVSESPKKSDPPPPCATQSTNKSYAAASRSNVPTPSTTATKQVVDLVELVKLYGDKLPTDKIVAMHQAAVGDNGNATNNTSIPQRKKFVVKSTMHGPTRKQVLVPSSETVTIHCLQCHQHILQTINNGLINQHSKLHVLAMSEGRSGDAFGLSFSTNLMPTLAEHEIIHEWISKAISCDKDKVPIPRAPMSKSYLKIIGVNFYTPTDWHDDGSNQLTPDDVLYIMNRNPLFERITLTSPPHVMRATPHSDMAIIWHATCTLESPNARIAGNGAILLPSANLKDGNVLSATVLIRPKTIATRPGVAK
ncbi:hypothetical protein AN958_08383 [Leucoagaricus sp. SymC.cos]|nr:hypothetical protein AN958_08383 [Leucoagaricus sp. SymC.cos]